jgi:uncharacterized protein
VDNFKQFILAISDLPLGITEYKFDIRDWFFENYDYSEIKKGKVIVRLSLEKQERMYNLHFTIKGYLTVICDRCGDEYDHPFKGEEDLIVKLGNKDYGDNDEIVVIHEHDKQIDISQNIFEYISLLLPMQHIHPSDSKGKSLCNQEALRIIDNLSAEKHKSNKTDPRWDELKKLLANN